MTPATETTPAALNDGPAGNGYPTNGPQENQDLNGYISPRETSSTNEQHGIQCYVGDQSLFEANDVQDACQSGEALPPEQLQAALDVQPDQWQVVPILLSEIGPSPFQPRENFDEYELAELSKSIKTHGVQQPVLVRRVAFNGAPGNSGSNTDKKATGKSKIQPAYELVAGERRWRASKLAGCKTIPAIVRELSDQAAAEIAVIENVQRANLSSIEEARGYKQLAVRFGLTESRIAKKVGKSVHTVKETLRLLALPEMVQTMLAKRQFTAAHGQQLLKLAPHPRLCESVAMRVVRDKLTAASLETNLLPNSGDLRRQKLIVELGFGTKFAWRTECAKCPFKAYVQSGYSSYCLRPDEWRKKQETAIALQEQESARVLEEARGQNEGLIDLTQLVSGSYRRLGTGNLPAGCNESCPCRSESCDPYSPTRRIQVCLNPQRFDELQVTVQQSELHARQQRYNQEWQDALARLRPSWNASDVLEEVAVDKQVTDKQAIEPVPEASATFSQTATDSASPASLIAALLVWPILKGDNLTFVQREGWQELITSIATSLEIDLPLGQILGFEPGVAAMDGGQGSDQKQSVSQRMRRLLEVPSDKLLLLGAALTLGNEAQSAIRWPRSTPGLNFVLGRTDAIQTEIDEGESDDENDEFYDYSDAEDDDEEDYLESLENEAEVEESFVEESIVEESIIQQSLAEASNTER